LATISCKYVDEAYNLKKLLEDHVDELTTLQFNDTPDTIFYIPGIFSPDFMNRLLYEIKQRNWSIEV